MNDQELAEAYAPVLCFSQGETFFPMDANSYLKDCSLHLAEGDNQEKMLLPPGYLNFDWIHNSNFNTSDKFLVYADRRGTSKAYLNALLELWQPERLEEAALMPEIFEEVAAGVWGVVEDVHEAIKAGVEKVTGSLLRQLAKTKAYEELRDALEKALGPKIYPETVLACVREQYEAVKDPYTYYFRVGTGFSGEYTRFVQYWYFYAFNPYINRHEADWECVTLFFDKEQPVKAFYSSHESGGKYGWDELETITDPVTNTQRPLVYVARGSHANYCSVEDVKRHSGSISLQGNLELPRDCHKPGGIIIGAHPKAQKDWGKADQIDFYPWSLFEGRWGVNVMHDGDELPDYEIDKSLIMTWDDELAKALIALMGEQKLAEWTSKLRGAPLGPMQHNENGVWDDPDLLIK